MELKVLVPDQGALTAEADGQLAVAQAYQITDVTMYQLAAGDLKNIKARYKELDEERKSITKPLDEAKTKIMDLYRRPLEKLAQAETIIKDALGEYDDKQEELRKAEEERLRQAQKFMQDVTDAYAENARIDAERAQAAAAAATPEQAEQAQAAVAAAAERLEHAQVEQTVVATAPTPIVATTTPKVSGISRKTTWKGEITDKMALIKAVAEGKAPATLVDINESVLNQMARAMKDTMNYPGVKAVEEKSIASSRR